MQVVLDENKFFTGTYAKIGSIENGVEVETLPPEENQTCYRLVEEKKERTNKVNIIEYIKFVYNENNELSEEIVDTEEIVVTEDAYNALSDDEKIQYGTRYKTDENGEYVTKDVVETYTDKTWTLDESKVSELNSAEIDKARSLKMNELSSLCEEAIIAGVDVETTQGIEHFDMRVNDQLNIESMKAAITVNPDVVLRYHSKGNNLCRVFTAEEINTIYLKFFEHKTYHLTLCNALRVQVSNMRSIDKINAITYAYESLTGTYKESFDTNMGIAQ